MFSRPVNAAACSLDLLLQYHGSDCASTAIDSLVSQSLNGRPAPEAVALAACEDLRSALAALSLCIKDHLGSTSDPTLQPLTRLTDRRLQFGRRAGNSPLMWLADHRLVADSSLLGTTVLGEYLSQRVYTKSALTALRRLMNSDSGNLAAKLKKRLQSYLKSLQGTLGARASIRTDIQGLLSCTTGSSFMLASQHHQDCSLMWSPHLPSGPLLTEMQPCDSWETG